MKVGKQGDAKRVVRATAQKLAEESAARTARSIWHAYWKKYDRERRRVQPKH